MSAPPPELGGLLRQARERSGRTLAELARETRIAERYLSALEQGAPLDLPEVYRRTFARTYAKALGLDPAAFAPPDPPPPEEQAAPEPGRRSVFDELPGGPPVEEAVATPVARNPFAEKSQVRTMSVVVILLVTALVMSVQWLGSGDDPPVPQPAAPAGRTAPEEAGRLGAFTRNGGPEGGTARGSPADSLILRATTVESVWVHVVIDNDSTVEYTLPPGYALTLRARDNFLLAVGNPAGIALTLNGRSVDVGGSGNRPRKNLLLSRRSIAD